MAPKYKLSYFDMRARGEPTRMLFAAAGIEFEDDRIPFDKWPSLKGTTPMGQLPVLEVDGVKLCQSMPIARFVARETGMAGKTNLEQAQADAFVDELIEMLPKLYGVAFATDEAKKAEMAAEFDKTMSSKLERCEKLSGSNGFLVGNSLLCCDLVLHTVAFNIENYKPGTLKGYPKLAKVMASVNANPKIAAWIAKRPDTKF
ncbi:PREDICTED: glutathione S-transferase 1-like [Branchiostoma belcheri]|uniref:glutathione transferase n=1 Tax=Branchiostoma belcheri TaxID=7741 RepID=A0A6P5ARB9_BRABE|nr:PREDICTED: glutathione S-transferase 1-like [Branchiostoma belcheri]